MPPVPAERTLLVTGASRGMGRGYVERYLREGWRVVATSRAALDLPELQDEQGDRLVTARLDVDDEASVAALGELLAGETLDLVINNAGVSLDEPFGKWTAAAFERSFRTNTIGPALVAQAVAPRMRDGATLVNVSSGMGSIGLGLNPTDGLDAYAASKAALGMLTRRLAEKLRPRGIVVVAISPGWVQTEMGGAGAPTPVEVAVEQVAETIATLSSDATGRFLSERGEELPW